MNGPQKARGCEISGKSGGAIRQWVRPAFVHCKGIGSIVLNADTIFVFFFFSFSEMVIIWPVHLKVNFCEYLAMLHILDSTEVQHSQSTYHAKDIVYGPIGNNGS